MSSDGLEFSSAAPGPLVEALSGRAARVLARLLERGADELLALRAARDERQRLADEGELPGFAAGSVPGGAEARPSEPCIELHAGPACAALGGADRAVVDLSAWLPVASGASMAPELCKRLQNAGPVEFGPRTLDVDVPWLGWQARPVPAALVDVALHTSRPAATSIRLTRLQSAAEAAWWAGVLDTAAIDGGPQPVTLGIDSVHAAFCGGAMLDALGDRATALCWDRHACLQSFVRTFRRHPQFVLPDLAELTGAVQFLRCWGWRVIGLAQARGLAAVAPPADWLAGEGADARALRADLERQLRDGYDGHGLADAALVAEAREIAERLLGATDGAARGERPRITGADLLQVLKGKITEHGMRHNLRIALGGYVALQQGEPFVELAGQRFGGSGVGLAADQLWQWVHHETGVLDDGRIIDAALFDGLLAETVAGDDGAGKSVAADALQAHVLADDLRAGFPLPAA